MANLSEDIIKDVDDRTRDAKRNTESDISSELAAAKNANAKLVIIAR